MASSTSFKQLMLSVSSSRKHFVIFLLGFVSGLPAALTASTLQAWFTEAGVSLAAIGAVTLLVLPYTIRFLWAPVFDYYSFSWIDRRRGWLFILQIGLVLAILLMSSFTPLQFFNFLHWQIPALMLIGCLVAFLSSSQDVVISAYQIEIFHPEERGLSSAILVTGWRIGAIISGAVALVLAQEIGWRHTYILMASLMLIGMLATYLGPAPYTNQKAPTKTLFQAVVFPFKEFFERFGFKTAGILLLLIITYKATDAFALALNTTFLLRKMGFDLATVGLVNKTVSLFASLLGGLVAGIFILRISLYRALMIFGVLQGLASLAYALMSIMGKSLFLLIFTAFTENFCTGMGGIALLALIMDLCNVNYTATQFALLSALAFLSRTIVGPVSARMVEVMGWTEFFIWCFIVSLPTLVFVYLAKETILQVQQDHCGK